MLHRAPQSAKQPGPNLGWLRSLRFRLTLWYIGILGCLLLLGACLLYAVAERALLTETDAFIYNEGRHLSAAAGGSGDDAPDERDLTEALAGVSRPQVAPSGGPRQAFGTDNPFLSFDMSYARIVQLTDPSGTSRSRLPAYRVLAQSPTIDAEPYVASALDALLRPPSQHLTGCQFAGDDEERRLRVATVPVTVGGRPAVIQVAVPWDHNADILEHLGAILTGCLMLVLLVAGAGGWILVARTLHPIGRIVEEAERLDASALPEALIPEASESDTEVGHLVMTLNRMMTRLRFAFDTQRRFAEAQQRFAADASHELRTPLTILRGEMDVALARPRGADAYRSVISSAVEEIDRMSRIVEGLSLVAEYDADHLAPNRPVELVDVALLTQVAKDELSGKALAGGVSVNISQIAADSRPRLVRADPEQLRLLLRNLIDNAVKYTEPGGRVDVSVFTAAGREISGQDVVVAVKDTGMGIAPDDLPHVFDRFWRADRTRNREGSGLGLAISRQIAVSYGGTLTAASQLGCGSEFTLRLPAAD